ncbi:MAG TPA: CopD family protein, partial [Flavisolibacter sp.]
MYLYLKALHIVFIVTWFAGLFYIVRLFIYNTEAQDKREEERTILQQQFEIMIRRLWLGITWPSAIITLVLGPWLMWQGGWHRSLADEGGQWLAVKLFFVAGLYCYHYSLHVLYKQQMRGLFRYSSQKLRMWNEVATVFLVAIVMLAAVKQSMSFVWGLAGLV